MLDHVDSWLVDSPAESDSLIDCIVLHGDQSRLPGSLLEQACHMPKDQQRQISLNGHSFLVIKLIDNRHDSHNLLILSKTEWANGDLQRVKGMVQVYQNFISVLYDSEKDTLTGLYNRRKLDTKLNEMVCSVEHDRRRGDDKHDIFLAILDLDRFKHINDSYGHLIGDEVLSTFTNIMRRTLRDHDMLFRYGGEEFMVLLRDITPESAHLALERLVAENKLSNIHQEGSIELF